MRSVCKACESEAGKRRYHKRGALRTKRALVAEYEADREMFIGLLADGAALYREALRRIAQLEGRER